MWYTCSMDLSFYFRSPAHIKILETLISLGRPVCFRDLVDLGGVSISSAQNALHFFQEAGLVKSYRAGQERRFSLKSHPDLPCLKELFRVAASQSAPKEVLPNGLKVLHAIERANRLALKGKFREVRTLHA